MNGHTFLACACAELVAHAPSSRRMTGTIGPDPRPDWLSWLSAPHCCRNGPKLACGSTCCRYLPPFPRARDGGLESSDSWPSPYAAESRLIIWRNHPSGHKVFSCAPAERRHEELDAMRFALLLRLCFGQKERSIQKLRCRGRVEKNGRVKGGRCRCRYGCKKRFKEP